MWKSIMHQAVFAALVLSAAGKKQPKADLTSSDYYKVLGVPRDASLKSVKSAYRRLALLCKAARI